MNTIILDLDCVVFEVSSLMQESFFLLTGKDIPVAQWSQYNVDIIYNEPMTSMLNALIKDSVLERALPISGAQEAIVVLKEKGFHLVACTNRSFHPNAHEITAQSLARHGILVDALIINPENRCKGLSCQAVAPADSRFTHIVDDHCANTASALRNGVAQEAVLITQPWNLQSRADSHTLRCHSLLEFARLV